jgi:phage antirepressor YoqD-like protein
MTQHTRRSRRYCVTIWQPLGPGDELLGHPVYERRLHSVRTAAQAIGIDQRRLRKVLVAKDIVPPAECGMPDAWQVFDAEQATPLLSGMTKLISAKEMADAINATRSQFDLLVADGVLKPELTAGNVKAVWNPADGLTFLNQVLRGAVQLRQAQHGWEHISKAAQRLKVGPGTVIAAILEGRIARVANRMGSEGYAAIHVYHDDVVAALKPIGHQAINIEDFAKSVGINQPSILKRLIEDGFVQTTALQNPTTKAMQSYFEPHDEVAFHAKFMTPRTLAQETGQSWQKVTHQLRAASIQPFSVNGQRYGSVFLRSEVRALLS